MGADIVTDKYSTAIFELAAENDILERLEGDLGYVREVLSGQPELRTVLFHPGIEAAEKCRLIGRIFGESVHKFALQFLYVMIKRRRESYISQAITSYISLSRAARNILEAEVSVVEPLRAEEEEALKAKLKAETGKDVILDVKIDPSLLGGMVLRIGDKRIDASVARGLEELKKTLLTANLTTGIGVNE